jgi:hypothetical protein
MYNKLLKVLDNVGMCYQEFERTVFKNGMSIGKNIRVYNFTSNDCVYVTVNSGNEIDVHGWDGSLLYWASNEDFKTEWEKLTFIAFVLGMFAE